MDAFKLAFDTIIVGALALPWLAIVVRIFFSGFSKEAPQETIGLLSLVPSQSTTAATSVLLVAIAYFVGSAVTRVADDFFDDSEIPYLPTERLIRNQVYCEEAGVGVVKDDGWLRRVSGKEPREALCPANKDAGKNPEYATELFELQEARILYSEAGKIERLQQLHEQLVVLRGAALNGILFSLLCLFGCLSQLRAKRGNPRSAFKALQYLAAAALIVAGLIMLREHIEGLRQPQQALWLSRIYSQPPTMEGVVMLVGIAGFFVVPLTEKKEDKLYVNGLFLGTILAILAYRGWWLSEVLYDQYVIHAAYTVASGAAGAAH